MRLTKLQTVRPYIQVALPLSLCLTLVASGEDDKGQVVIDLLFLN
jgi:hypothetical protein